MKKLIEGQEIRIDNHHSRSGTGLGFYDDRANDLHLHKIVRGKKNGGRYNIRIPLNTERAVTVDSIENKVIPSKILNEIKDAFDNIEKRKKFVDEVVDTLNHVPVRHKKITDKEKIFNSLEKIAIAFHLDWNEKLIERYIKESKYYRTEYIVITPQDDFTAVIKYKTKEKRFIVADNSKINHRYDKDRIPFEKKK